MFIVYAMIDSIQNNEENADLRNSNLEKNKEIRKIESLSHVEYEDNIEENEEQSLMSIEINSNQDFRIQTSDLRNSEQKLSINKNRDYLEFTNEIDFQKGLQNNEQKNIQEDNMKTNTSIPQDNIQQDKNNSQNFFESSPLLASPRRGVIDYQTQQQIIASIHNELSLFDKPNDKNISQEEWDIIKKNIEESVVYCALRKGTRYDRSADIKNNLKEIIKYFYGEIYSILFEKKFSTLKKYLNLDDCKEIISADICNALSFFDKRKKVLEILERDAQTQKILQVKDFTCLSQEQQNELLPILTEELSQNISDNFNKCLSHLASINFVKFDYRNFVQAGNIVSIKKRCINILLSTSSVEDIQRYADNKNRSMATCLIATIEEESAMHSRKLTVIGSLVLCGILLIYTVTPKDYSQSMDNSSSSTEPQQLKSRL